MSFCPNCGAENQDHHKFCGTCGQSLAKPEDNPSFNPTFENYETVPSNVKSYKSKKGLKIAITVFVFLLPTILFMSNMKSFFDRDQPNIPITRSINVNDFTYTTQQTSSTTFMIYITPNTNILKMYITYQAVTAENVVVVEQTIIKTYLQAGSIVPVLITFDPLDAIQIANIHYSFSGDVIII